MEETKATNSNEILQPNQKMEWEPPKLINLKTEKTFGGGNQLYTEDDSYSPGPS